MAPPEQILHQTTSPRLINTPIHEWREEEAALSMPHINYFLRFPSKLRRRARRSRLAAMFLLFSTIFVFCAPFYCIYKPPTLLIRYFQYRWPEALWHVPTRSKIIALTIDDAPSEFSREIMQLLKDNNATATFFVIGAQAPGREDILRDLVRNGNELGNHAMHDEPSRSLSDETLTSQIKTVEQIIDTAYNDAESDRSNPKLFRPGSGFFSDRMLKILDKLEYRLVLGSIYPHDPQIPYWRVNARHILSMVRPGGIIICHDRRPWTIPMLRKVIPEIKRRGFRIATVSELLRELRE
jgi:peptidoglycan/xylan/chitin deacetylase (PgdA/CDA1 family)